MKDRPTIVLGSDRRAVQVYGDMVLLGDVFPEQTVRGFTFREVLVTSIAYSGDDVVINEGAISFGARSVQSVLREGRKCR